MIKLWVLIQRFEIRSPWLWKTIDFRRQKKRGIINPWEISLDHLWMIECLSMFLLLYWLPSSVNPINHLQTLLLLLFNNRNNTIKGIIPLHKKDGQSSMQDISSSNTHFWKRVTMKEETGAENKLHPNHINSSTFRVHQLCDLTWLETETRVAIILRIVFNIKEGRKMTTLTTMMTIMTTE